MECRNITIQMPIDLTGRYVHRLIYKLQAIDSSIHFIIKDRSVNAKSLIGMFSAQIKKGDTVKVVCYGGTEEQTNSDLQAIQKALKELAVMDNES